MYFKTVSKSVHKCILPIFSFSSVTILNFNLEAKTAACCPSLRIVMVLFPILSSLLLLIKQKMLSAATIITLLIKLYWEVLYEQLQLLKHFYLGPAIFLAFIQLVFGLNLSLLMHFLMVFDLQYFL